MSTDDPRDEILLAFHQACPCPTATQIIVWTRRYPQFAEDIRGHAAIARDWTAREGFPVEEPDEEMLERGRKRTLDALREARSREEPVHFTEDDVKRASEN